MALSCLVGSCLPVTFLEDVSQNCFVLQVFNMHFRKEIAYKMHFSTALALVSSSSSQLYNMHFGRKSRRRASFCKCSTCTLEGCPVQNAFSRDSGRTKCSVFQYKGRLRTWQVKLCGTTVAERPRVILGSCSDHVRIVPPL